MTALARIAVPDDHAIREAVQRLEDGRLVAFPTETVYGLGADARNPAAVRAVFALKGRPTRNPLIVHVTGPGMARALVANWPREAQDLADAFWPGPLTIVLPRSPIVPGEVTAGGPTVAIRAPDHPVARRLIAAFGSPIVGPSANRSGRVSPTTAAHVLEEFPEADLLILDGGPCTRGIESTVLSIDPLAILRPGPVSAADVERVVRRPVQPGASPGAAADAAADEGQRARQHHPLPSPGLLPAHYAPRAPARLLSRREIIRHPRDAGTVILMRTHVSLPGEHATIWMPTDPAPYAARLYAALRDADALRPRLILIERPPSGNEWLPILDRLTRACR